MNILKRTLLTCAAIVALIPLTAAAANDQPSKEQVIQSRLEKSVAPIRSEEDLQVYLTASAINGSPLDVLNEESKSAFLASLVFTENGVGSLRHDVLAGLSVFEAYRILGLFGWQDRTSIISDLVNKSTVDNVILSQSATKNLDCTVFRSDCEGWRPYQKCESHWSPAYVCDRCACSGAPK